MSFDEDLQAFAELVASGDFQQKQAAFFDKYCHACEESEENTLSYVEIFKAYGPDRLKRLQSGFQACLASGRDLPECTEEVVNNLVWLTDQDAVKAAMLAKKQQKGAVLDKGIDIQFGPKIIRADTGIDLQFGPKIIRVEAASAAKDSPAAQTELETIESVFDQAAEQLARPVDEAEGWTVVVQEPHAVFYSKPGPPGLILLRYSIIVDFPAEHYLNGMMDMTPESAEWRAATKLTLLQERSPLDKVVTQHYWGLVVYLLSLPREVVFRMVGRPGWPTAVDHTFVAVSYDPRKSDFCVGTGPVRRRGTIVSPLPEDPSKMRLNGLDVVSLGIAPMWAVSYLIKKTTIPGLVTFLQRYKAAKGL